MANSLNKIMLIGRLGKDAETRFTTTNQSVTSFTLATDHSYKGKDGNWVNETTWHNVVAWSLTDFMKENLKKGKKFYVEGRLTKRDYTDKEGIKRFVTEVVAERLIPLEGREGESTSTDYSREAAPAVEHSTNDSGHSVDENDDLPF
ncbi:MAG: single-stranded DNA-binding protein [Bacillota bacterium]